MVYFRSDSGFPQRGIGTAEFLRLVYDRLVEG
jgi:hypothetical protein